MYPVNFLGLGRGLDFLLPSFLVSRQEKKVEARWIRPTEYHFNDDECRKRDTFSRYNDLIIWERITFLGYSFHRWNVCGAYAIRPYRVTEKRIDFLRYNDLIIWKRITFSISIMYPASFPGLCRGLDFLLSSFLVSRQGPYRGREVFPGTFLRWILYLSLSFDPFSRLHHVPGQLPRPRQRPWFSFAFFSCIKTRKEGRGKMNTSHRRPF